MDSNVPAGAVILLDFIRPIETGRTDPAQQYTTVIGHKQGNLKKPITEMTLDELTESQRNWPKNWRVPSTAAGGYQIIRKTLLGVMSQMGLPGSTKFTPSVQDRMGFHLLKGRGWSKFQAGQISVTQFGNELSKEWASLPVLTDMQGASRAVKVGQSYYAGDGINKSLVTPEQFRDVLGRALNASIASTPQPAPKPVPKPIPVNELPRTGKGWGLTGWGLLAALAAGAVYFLFFHQITL